MQRSPAPIARRSSSPQPLLDKSHSKHIDLRLINESGERGDDHRVDSLAWNAEDELAGKSVHLRGFPKGHQTETVPLDAFHQAYG